MKLFRLLLLILLFFPFIGPIPDIDVQPLFFAYGSIFLLFSLFKAKVPSKTIVLFSFVLMAILIRFFFELGDLTFKYAATYIMSVITPFILYILINSGLIKVSSRQVLYMVGIYIGVALVQLFIDPKFMGWIVARSTDRIDLLEQTSRGMRSLASEPSSYGTLITGFNILYVFLLFKEGANNSTFKHAIIGSFVLLALSAVTAQSSYALVIQFGIISALILVLKKGKYLLMYLLILLTAYFIYDAILSNGSSRLGNMFRLLFNNPELLMKQSAFRRLMNIPISINNAFHFGLLGAGNSSEVFFTSINTPFGEYPYVATNRNFGGFVEYFLKFGILSFPFYVFYFRMLYQICKVKTFFKNQNYRLGLFFAFSLLVYTFQAGSPVNPFTWFILIYVYYNRNYLKFSQYSLKTFRPKKMVEIA